MPKGNYKSASELEKMFIVFRQFFHCSNLSMAQSQPLVLPAAVSSAFAVEVGLKLLLALHQKDVPRVHELDDLFNRQPKEIQDALEEVWKSKYMIGGTEFGGEIAPVTLKEALVRSRSAFVQWRYLWQGQTVKVYYLHVLAVAIDHVLIKLKPGWSSLYAENPGVELEKHERLRLVAEGFSAGLRHMKENPSNN